MKRAAALIVAAGSGERAGGGMPKQFRPLAGKPVLQHATDLFAAHPGFCLTVVTAPRDHVAQAAALAPDALCIAGGATRADSVRAGLEALRGTAPDFVFIHDAARPGLTSTMLDRLLDVLQSHPATAPYLPLADSLRQVDVDGALVGCPPREGLVRVQTPQAFWYDAIVKAYAAWPHDYPSTDDLEVGFAAGLKAKLVDGAIGLHKLTVPEDFAMLNAVLSPALLTRVGSGFDAHRLGPGDHVMLCGVRIPDQRALIGHSDADVGWHALTDAILGALGEGDIGDHFPPTDPRWKGAASSAFLAHAAGLVQARGGRIVNVDVTLICERPRIKPHRAAMRAATAAVLGVAETAVSIKATTTEEMGFTGRGEGIAAQATACIGVPV